MYRLATKRIAKNEVRNAIRVYGLRLHASKGVENAQLVVNNDTLSVLCRNRTVGLCCPSNLLVEYSASTLAITMNSVKIDITQWLF